MQLEPGPLQYQVSPPQVAMNVDPRGPLLGDVVRARRSGRPNVNDTWDLKLKKNEFLKVLKYHGRNWWLLENGDGERGYAYMSWIDFDWRGKLDMREAYHRFHHDTEKLLSEGPIATFLNLKVYMRASCQNQRCLHHKTKTDLGVCIHELASLLKGFSEFSYAFVKDQRNQWHPDRFSRLCVPEKKDVFAKKAEQLFMLMSGWMDHMERESRG